MDVKYEDYRDTYEVKHKLPFSSSRKRMSVVINYNESAHLFIKGASEMVLSSCTQWFNSQNGEIEPISTDIQENLKKTINNMAENSLRTLCFGYKKLMAHDDLEVKDSKGVYACEKENITLIAIIGVKDEPRKEVPDAIRKGSQAAAKKMILVPIEKGTLPHQVLGEFDAGKILFKPASVGTGVKAAGACRTILELAGVQNVLTKSLRGSNPHNVVKATFDALLQLRDANAIARERGITLEQVFNA